MKNKNVMPSVYQEGIEALLKLDEFVEFFVYFGIKYDNNNSLLNGEQLELIQKICERHILSKHEEKAELYTTYIGKYKEIVNTYGKSTPFKVIDLIIKSIINNYENNSKLKNKVYNIISPVLYNPNGFILNTDDTNTNTTSDNSESTLYYLKHPLKAVQRYYSSTFTDTQPNSKECVDYNNDIYECIDVHIESNHIINNYQPLYLLIELNDKNYSFDQIPKKCSLNKQYYSMKYVIVYNTSSKKWVRFEFSSLKEILKENKINELIFRDIIYINESVDVLCK